MPKSSMPTAANLVAAAAYGALGFVVSGQVMALFEPERQFGVFVYVNIVIGLLVGWLVVGRRIGRRLSTGWIYAVNIGISGAILLVFWGLFVQSANLMLARSTQSHYANASEAIGAMADYAVEWFLMILTVPICATLVVGGVIAGLAAEYASRVWR